MANNSKLHSLNIMRVAQLQKNHDEAKAQLKDLEEKYKAAIKEVDSHKKKSETHEKRYATLESKHTNTQKELHKLKLAFDGDYAFRYKEDKREALTKARTAKAAAKKRAAEKSKAKRGSAAASRKSR